MLEHPPPFDDSPLAWTGHWGGILVDRLRSPEALPALRAMLASLLEFRNFIALEYNRDRAPALLASSFDRDYLLRHLHDYLLGLYQLDPFHALADGQALGLYRMRDIAPEGFERSEYYQRHYQATQVIDELRYVVPLGPGRSVHLLIEREAPDAPFAANDLARLADLLPLVSGCSARHLEWRDAQQGEPPAQRAQFDLRATIMSIAPGDVTTRECDIIELMLKGHSVKSMAAQLAIEEVTVTNHKRNIYAKLQVHSQAQLFDRFLRALARTPA